MRGHERHRPDNGREKREGLPKKRRKHFLLPQDPVRGDSLPRESPSFLLSPRMGSAGGKTVKSTADVGAAPVGMLQDQKPDAILCLCRRTCCTLITIDAAAFLCASGIRQACRLEVAWESSVTPNSTIAPKHALTGARGCPAWRR